MATFKVLLHSANKRKNGNYPVSLRITKNMKHKYISLGLYAKKEEWDEKGERFRCDKRVCPNYKEYNARIIQLLARVQKVEFDFECEKTDWTLNQFADAFLHKSKQSKFLDFTMCCINEMKAVGHIGNAKVWERLIYNMKLFDKKLQMRYFQEIDLKYVNSYNQFMEKRNWCGNTRKHDMKTLRAILNRAIKAKEYSGNSYPFGKGGFCISALEEETRKRYLPQEYLDKLMTTKFENKPKETARYLFLFSYFCYGMSFIDMAYLKKGILRQKEEKNISSINGIRQNMAKMRNSSGFQLLTNYGHCSNGFKMRLPLVVIICFHLSPKIIKVKSCITIFGADWEDIMKD